MIYVNVCNESKSDTAETQKENIFLANDTKKTIELNDPPILPKEVVPFQLYNDTLIVREEEIDPRVKSASSFFDRVFVINLEKRTERWFQTKRRLEGLGVHPERILACDGELPEYKNHYELYKAKPMTSLENSLGRKTYGSPGAWAQQFSARKMLQTAKERGYDSILMIEDDVLFHRNFGEEFHTHMDAIPDNWELIYLGASQHSWTPPGSLAWAKNTDLYYHPYRTDGAFGVAIRHTCFDRLIKEIDRRIGPFDSYPLRSILQKNQKRSFVLRPNIVIADVTDSDTQGARDQKEFAKKMRWNLSLYDSSPIDQKYLEDPLISVIIVTKNSQDFIEMTISSVLSQSYKRFELIIIDDGSTDDTLNTVSRLEVLDPRIKILRNKASLGIIRSLNSAIEVSKGEIIAFQNQFDISDPDRLRKQSAPLINGIAVISTVNCGFGDSATRIMYEDHFKTRTSSDEIKYLVEPDSEIRFDVERLVILKRVFRKVGGLKELTTQPDAAISYVEFLDRVVTFFSPKSLESSQLAHEYLQTNNYILHAAQYVSETLVYNFSPGEENTPIEWNAELLMFVKAARSSVGM